MNFTLNVTQNAQPMLGCTYNLNDLCNQYASSFPLFPVAAASGLLVCLCAFYLAGYFLLKTRNIDMPAFMDWIAIVVIPGILVAAGFAICFVAEKLYVLS